MWREGQRRGRERAGKTRRASREESREERGKEKISYCWFLFHGKDHEVGSYLVTSLVADDISRN
jgi:hypothetical protein